MPEIPHESLSRKTAVLSCEIQRFRYAGSELDTLQNINLELKPGSLTVIVGDSGSGKSTLGAVLAGMLPRYGTDLCQGRITLAGQRIEYDRTQPARINVAGWAKHVGLLPQEAGHYLSRIRETVSEELAFSLENEGMARAEMRQRITRLSQRLNLDQLLQRDPAKLSGGQERMVALAALAICEPAVMVLDEPLAGLDAEAISAVSTMITQLRATGTALVILSREPGPWASNADSLWALDQGNLRAMSAINSAARTPSVRRNQDFEEAQSLLRFTDVQLGYADTNHRVVQGFDLQVRAGECVGLAGPNGSGKSTVLKAAAGLLKPLGGRLEAQAETGMLLQNPSDQLFERTVLREVSFGLPKRGKQREKVLEVLTQLGLGSEAQTHPYELPASARRLVALATVMVREPQILLLDEPTESLDAAGIAALQHVIDSVLARGGAVLLSSHDQQFMKQSVHRIHQMPRKPEFMAPGA